MKMSRELTLEVLDKAIAQVRAIERESEIVGFKVHPADLQEIKAHTSYLVGADSFKTFCIPPYEGMVLVPDVKQPRGFVKPIRRGEA